MKNKKNILIFGAGSVGTHHANAARSLNCNVIVCDVNFFQFEYMKNKLYPSRYGTWDDKIKFVSWLEESKIETRQVFGGNILKQPGFNNIKHRISGSLEGSDLILNNTIFFGVYPGITKEMREYVVDRIYKFFK